MPSDDFVSKLFGLISSAAKGGQKEVVQPRDFSKWLSSASVEELYAELNSLWEADGPRAEFFPITERIQAFDPPASNAILYGTFILLAKEGTGGHERQAQYYEKACSIAQKEFGANGAEVLECLEKISWHYSLARKIAKWEKATTTLLKKQELIFGEDSEKLIPTLDRLASVVSRKYGQRSSRFTELWPIQEAYLHRALKIAETHYPQDGAAVAPILADLAWLYGKSELKQYERAAEFYRRLHKIPESERSSFPCAFFGEVLIKLGRTDEVDELRKQYPEMRL